MVWGRARGAYSFFFRYIDSQMVESLAVSSVDGYEKVRVDPFAQHMLQTYSPS